jgi:hypothetical protein
MTLGAIPRGPGFNSRSAHSFSALVAIISYNSRASQVHCIKQLTALQLSESGNVQEHAAALSELLDRLGGLNLSFHDDVRSSLLLASLPESWNTFVIALEARENALGFEGASDLILVAILRSCATGARSIAIGVWRC